MVFRFAEFELDDARFELRRAGQVVATQPKVLRLLLLLVARRHRAVSDDELMAELWPNETVGHGSIKRAILGARTVLGEQGAEGIRTIRGLGYQFVLPVHDRERASSTPHATGPRVFVGRQGPLAEFETRMHEVAAGRGSCLLFSGEPGIGKSRLLAEVERRAVAAGARVWLGRCSEVEGAPPCWPVLQILREAVREHSVAELQALLGAGAPDVAEVFPELRHTLSDVMRAPPIAASHARFRFLDSMTRFFTRAARQRPLVLVFDDLQRADAQTLHVLAFLLGQIERAAVLVVGATRPAYEGGDADAQRFFELMRLAAPHTIELTGLAPDEVAQYVQLTADDTATAAVVAELHEQTAGNPLFLEVVLRGVRALKADAKLGSSQLAQSRGVREAIDRHLATLPEPCRAILATASVLGRDISTSMLSELTDQPVDDVLGALDRATEGGVLQPCANADHRFAHALIRDALYERIPTRERAALHGRLAHALEARGAAWDPSELPRMAEHFLLAAPSHDGGKALSYVRRAAEQARARMAHEDAAHQLQRALSLVDRIDPAGPERTQLWLEYGEALTLSSKLDAARAALLKAAALARANGDVDRIAHAARWLTSPRESGAVDDVLVALLREALSKLPQSDPRTPCLQALLAKALSYSGEHVESRAQLLSALPRAKRITDPRLRAETLLACHEALTEPEQRAERLEIARALEQLLLEPHEGRERTELDAAATAFQACMDAGNVLGLDGPIQRMEALADRTRDPLVRWFVLSCSAGREMLAARPMESERLAKAAYALRDAVGEDFAYHQYCVQMNGPLRLTGRVAEAEAMTRGIAARYPALPGWRAVLGCIEADQGRIEPAQQQVELLAANGFAVLRRTPYALGALCPMADLCAVVASPEIASQMYGLLKPYAEMLGTVSIGGATHGPIDFHLARLALRAGDVALAAQHCERGLATAERMPAPIFVMAGCLTYAFICLHSTEASAAVRGGTYAKRALAIAEAGGMPPMIEHCRFLLAHFGEPPAPQAFLSLN